MALEPPQRSRRKREAWKGASRGQAAVPSRRPIRHHQPRHPLELAAVRRHQSSAAASRLRSNQIIIGADRRALALQMRADVAGMRGIFGIEWENIDAETEKPFEQPLAMLPPVAFGDT